MRQERESKGKLVFMQGCALILYYFVVEHIPASEIDLVSVVSPRMLKWETIPQYKTLRAVQKVFFGASKKVIVELRPTTNERHLLIGLNGKGTTKKITVEATKEKVVEGEPMALSESSSEYVNVFFCQFLYPIKKGNKEGQEGGGRTCNGCQNCINGDHRKTGQSGVQDR